MGVVNSKMSWANKEDIEFLKNNLDLGWSKLAKHFGCRETAVKRKAQSLGLRARVKKEEKEKKEPLPATTEKFNPKKHKILNSDVSGKIPLYIPSIRATVYITENQNPQDIIAKYENRKVSW